MMSRTRFLLLLLCAFVAWPIWRILTYRRGKTKSKVKNILVVPQTNRLGDMVCATPVLRAIKEKYPEARVSVLVSKTKGAWQILQHNPRVDQLFLYETPRLITALRAARFDYALLLTNNPIPSVIAWLALIPVRAKTVVSPRSLSEKLTDWLNTETFFYAHHTSVTAQYLRVLTPLQIQNEGAVKEVFFAPDSVQKVEQFLSQTSLGARRLLGISVTAGNKVKEWGVANFARLADRAITERQVGVVFIGSVHDTETIKQVQALMKSAEQSVVATNFSIAELPALMHRFSAFVGVDTGPVYVAEALGIPVVDIIGPCDWREQSPAGEKSRCVLPVNVEPSVFVFQRPGTNEQQQRALASISVEQVWAALNTLL